MYKPHPVCELPELENSPIWKFMDLPKLLSIIDKKSLFFSRTNSLGKYDRFEGHYPRKTAGQLRRGREKAINDIIEQMRDHGTPTHIIEEYLALNQKAPTSDEAFRELICLNCWHLSDYESAGMWSIYTNRGYGVAIQSTCDQLCDAFCECEIDVHVGKVTYINYDDDSISSRNALYPFMYKRMSFEHEHELRAVVLDLGYLPEVEDYKIKYALERTENGVYIPINVSTLINSISVAPKSDRWFAELVKNVVSQYGIEAEVRYSELDKEPY